VGEDRGGHVWGNDVIDMGEEENMIPEMKKEGLGPKKRTALGSSQADPEQLVLKDSA